MLRLAIGARSQLCPVAETFKLLVLVDQEQRRRASENRKEAQDPVVFVFAFFCNGPGERKQECRNRKEAQDRCLVFVFFFCHGACFFKEEQASEGSPRPHGLILFFCHGAGIAKVKQQTIKSESQLPCLLLKRSSIPFFLRLPREINRKPTTVMGPIKRAVPWWFHSDSYHFPRGKLEKPQRMLALHLQTKKKLVQSHLSHVKMIRRANGRLRRVILHLEGLGALSVRSPRTCTDTFDPPYPLSPKPPPQKMGLYLSAVMATFLLAKQVANGGGLEDSKKLIQPMGALLLRRCPEFLSHEPPSRAPVNY